MHIHEISCEKWSTVEAYTKYKDYCTERGHKFISNMPGFLGDLKQKYDIDKKRKTDCKNKLTVLILTDEGKQRYAKLLSEDEEEAGAPAGAPLWLQLEAFKQFIPDEKMREFFDLREKLRLGF